MSFPYYNPVNFINSSTISCENQDNPSRFYIRRFKAAYGVSPSLAPELWRYCYPSLQEKAKPKHLLWSLRFLKTYETEEQIAHAENCNKKTFRAWRDHFVPILSQLRLIDFETRCTTDPFKCCNVSIDGTDMPIFEPTPFNSRWYSFKLNGLSLRYEVALDISNKNIAWINGPFCPGSYTDLMVFRHDLKQVLPAGEKVLADDGYKDDLCVRKCHLSNFHDLNYMNWVMARHENINARLKKFKVLHHTFRLSLDFHVDCFFAVANITQLLINTEEPLFD